jgi:hypothetical protein
MKEPELQQMKQIRIGNTGTVGINGQVKRRWMYKPGRPSHG